MTKITKLFIARDGEKNGKNDGGLWQFEQMPTYYVDNKIADKFTWDIEDSLPIELNFTDYPHIKNGECYEYELKEIGKVEL